MKANGLRQIEVSATIDENENVTLGTDKFGQNMILLGIETIDGGTLRDVTVTSEQWGNREIILPSTNNDVEVAGSGPWIPPLFPEIIANSTTTVRAFQGSAGPELESVILKYMLEYEGKYPAPIMPHIGQLHSQVLAGTATDGEFPGKGDPTDSQDILNEMENDKWLALLTASIGGTPGQVVWSHPQDDGYPAMGQTVASTGLGQPTFQPIAPTNPLNGADRLKLLAKDDSGSAVRAYLYMGRITNGMKAISNRSIFSV